MECSNNAAGLQDGRLSLEHHLYKDYAHQRITDVKGRRAVQPTPNMQKHISARTGHQDWHQDRTGQARTEQERGGEERRGEERSGEETEKGFRLVLRTVRLSS